MRFIRFMRFLSPLLIALTVLVVCIEQSPAQNNVSPGWRVEKDSSKRLPEPTKITSDEELAKALAKALTARENDDADKAKQARRFRKRSVNCRKRLPKGMLRSRKRSRNCRKRSANSRPILPGSNRLLSKKRPCDLWRPYD